MLTEADEILSSAKNLSVEMVRAAREIYSCKGRVVVIGLGKSGHIARKISATLASLGTPSFFLHAAEALHGDLGMIRNEDCAVFVSNSGSSNEIMSLIPLVRRTAAVMIAVTGSLTSPLAESSDIVINAHVSSEGDPLHLAPMSSTTLELVLGDALAVMVALLRHIRREDFAMLHPGGALGRKLLTRVRDVMGTGENLPVVAENVTVKDALFVITGKGYGATCIINDSGNLTGIFTDGDLRRLMERSGNDAFSTRITDAMTLRPKTISPDALAAEAVRIMEREEISVLVAVEGEKPIGMVHIHELLKAGIA